MEYLIALTCSVHLILKRYFQHLYTDMSDNNPEISRKYSNKIDTELRKIILRCPQLIL
jgi:hypothetical protein